MSIVGGITGKIVGDIAGGIVGGGSTGGGGSTLLDGLIAWWSMNETTGDRIDSHTNGLDLTANGGVGQVAGVVGNAVSYDGTGWLSRLKANSDLLNHSVTGTSFTFAGWIKRTAEMGSQGILSFAIQYQLFWQSNKLRFRIYDSGYRVIDTPVAVAIDTDVFVIIEYDAVGRTFSMTENNGTPQTAAAHATTGLLAPNKDFFLGTTSSGSGMIGVQDEWVAYNRILTTAEKTELFAGIPYPG